METNIQPPAICSSINEKRWQRFLREWAWIAVILLALAQCLAPFWWVAELFTHFTFIGAVGIGIVAVVIRGASRYLLAVLAIVVIVWGMTPVSGLFASIPVSSNTKSVLRLATYNVQINNPHLDKESAFLQSLDADLLLLAEAGERWQPYLAKLNKHYPYGCAHKADSPFALQVLSRLPLASCQVIPIHFSGLDFPSIRVQTTDRRVIFLLHPPPPLSRRFAHARNHYLQLTATLIRQETLPTLVVGDLNNTPFSPLFRRFITDADLSHHTYRALPTWRPYFLPIDHVLTRKDDKTTIDVHALAWQDSDHRPLFVRWNLYSQD